MSPWNQENIRFLAAAQQRLLKIIGLLGSGRWWAMEQ